MRARVLAAFLTAAERPAEPLVRTAFLAAAERDFDVRLAAAFLACDESADVEAAS